MRPSRSRRWRRPWLPIDSSRQIGVRKRRCELGVSSECRRRGRVARGIAVRARRTRRNSKSSAFEYSPFASTAISTSLPTSARTARTISVARPGPTLSFSRPYPSATRAAASGTVMWSGVPCRARRPRRCAYGSHRAGRRASGPAACSSASSRAHSRAAARRGVSDDGRERCAFERARDEVVAQHEPGGIDRVGEIRGRDLRRTFAPTHAMFGLDPHDESVLGGGVARGRMKRLHERHVHAEQLGGAQHDGRA